MTAGTEAHGALPLWRRRILITRPRARAEEWIAALLSAGGDVVIYPVFAMELPGMAERNDVGAAVRELVEAPAPWLAFTSAQAVASFCEILEEQGQSIASAKDVRVAVVGPATAQAARAHGFSVTFEAEPATSDGLARGVLARDARPSVLHPTSASGLTDLEDSIHAAGGVTRRVIVTVQRRNSSLNPAMLQRELADGGLDVLTFASPSAVAILFDSVPGAMKVALRKIPSVAIGQTTEKALHEHRFPRVERALTPTAAEVVRACVDCLKGDFANPPLARGEAPRDSPQ